MHCAWVDRIWHVHTISYLTIQWYWHTTFYVWTYSIIYDLSNLCGVSYLQIRFLAIVPCDIVYDIAGFIRCSMAITFILRCKYTIINGDIGILVLDVEHQRKRATILCYRTQGSCEMTYDVAWDWPGRLACRLSYLDTAQVVVIAGNCNGHWSVVLRLWPLTPDSSRWSSEHL